ncbi:MAG: PAS domain S-box protein [Thermoplasmatota archaeon]
MKKDLSKEVLEENKNKIKNLHEAAVKLENIHDKDEVYQFSIDSAENILDFYMSTILIEGEVGLVVKSSHRKGIDKGAVLDIDDGIYGLTYKNKKSYLINDLDESPKAAPYSSDFNSVISVPIGDYGVFQVISDEKDYFNEHDLEMAKIWVKHIEEALKRIEYEIEIEKREKRCRLITENSNDMISLLNRELKPIFVNNAHKRILGYNEEELKNKNVIDFIHPDFQEKVKKEINKIINNESKKNIETKFRCKDGGYIWIESNIRVLSDYFNSKTLVIVSRDITERKKTEHQLKEAEKLYKNIFENTGNPTIIVDDDKTISLVNREFTKLTGYSKEEVENKMELSDIIVEEDYNMIKEYHEKRREEPESVPSEYIYKIINKFGHPFNVLCKVGVIPNTNKRISSLIDVSKYRETMEELRKSQETFRVVFENMNYGMLLLDPELNIIEVNPKFQEMLNYHEGELNNENMFDIIPPEYKNNIKECKENLLKKKSESEKRDIEMIDGDGKKMEIILNMNAVFDTQDELLYLICGLQKLD